MRIDSMRRVAIADVAAEEVGLGIGVQANEIGVSPELPSCLSIEQKAEIDAALLAGDVSRVRELIERAGLTWDSASDKR
jgi:hypothetical protein